MHGIPSHNPLIAFDGDRKVFAGDVWGAGCKEDEGNKSKLRINETGGRGGIRREVSSREFSRRPPKQGYHLSTEEAIAIGQISNRTVHRRRTI